VQQRGGRPGLALIALVTIVAITMAWWALALWPVGTSAPEWIARTRAACFGAGPDGLPDAGGWILLIGEPLGMIGTLIAVWGRSLASDLRRLGANPVARVVGSTLVIAVIVAVGMLAERVTRAYGWAAAPLRQGQAVRTKPNVDAPRVSLTDQEGRLVSFADYRGAPVLLTFGFGHCTTVCPTVVHDLLAARQAAGRTDVRLVVLTLDPWRDTPDRLPWLVAHWGLAPGDRVLSGSVAAVDSALGALGVGRTRDERTGEVAHAATVMYVDERGTIAWRLDGWWGDVGRLLSR